MHEIEISRDPLSLTRIAKSSSTISHFDTPMQEIDNHEAKSRLVQLNIWNWDWTMERIIPFILQLFESCRVNSEIIVTTLDEVWIE